MFLIIAFIIACFFAMNIGASGAAASMGVAYGAGAIKRNKHALILCGVGIFLGAVLGGGEVAKTIGKGIVSDSFMTPEVAIIILFSATITLFLANLIGIPLSTSEVTVGAVVGVGVAYQVLYVNKLFIIVVSWLVVPFIAFLLVFLIGKKLLPFEKKVKPEKKPRLKKWLIRILIVAGLLEAFAAGMNNVGNVIGPLIGSGLLSISLGTVLGGAFIALGAFIFGKKVLETNGKKITRISLLQGITISTTSAGLVIMASVFGIPIPITQVTTSAILGIDGAKNGVSIFQKNVLHRILKVWVVSPIISLVISYGLIKAFFVGDFYSVFIIVSVVAATLGTISLVKSIRQEKRAIQEYGGGI